MSFGSKKSYKPKRVRKKSSPITLGSHVPDLESARKTADSALPSYAGSRAKVRGRSGVVSSVMPQSQRGATDRSKRADRERYLQSLERQARIKRIVGVVLVLLLVILVATGVGSFAYATSVSDRMALTDESTKGALTAANEGEAEYVLLVGEYSQLGQDYDGPSLLTLVRLDSPNKQITLMSIPTNLRVTLSNGETGRIQDAQLLGGDPALIKEVEKLAGVSISHIVKTDNAQFVSLVDSFGGINVEVSEEIDDPKAGPEYIAQGSQVLNGSAALTFCRATNLSDGINTRAENQNRATEALGNKLASSEGLGMVFTLEGIADMVETDYSVGDIMSFAGSFKGISSDAVYRSSVPGYTTTSTTTGIEYYVLDDSLWESMCNAMKEGLRPEDAIPEVGTADPASFTLIVRNGSGVTGGASQVADLLGAGGFKVTDTGNTDTFVYDETLVVYKDDAHEASAESAVSYLGVGRVVASNGFYAFDSDVLVVVGKDWKPLN